MEGYKKTAHGDVSHELPNDSKLTTKELYCISRHVKFLVEKIYQEQCDIHHACYDCPERKTCDWNFMYTLAKLGSITGVNIYFAHHTIALRMQEEKGDNAHTRRDESIHQHNRKNNQQYDDRF